MSLSSYLASKYLNAETSSAAKSKKRKRKTPSAASGLTIADDDALGWSTNPNADEDIDGPLIASSSSEFRKSKKNAWKVVGEPAPQPNDHDAAAADAIIASTAAENNAARHLDEEPSIAAALDDGVVKMSDGTHAGLQTAAAVTAQLEARQRAERAAWAAEEAAQGHSKKGAKEETVYRDATGRRIDIAMKRAELRAAVDQQAQEDQAARDAQTGDVQRAAQAQRREALEEAKFLPVARTADDDELNRHLKDKMRWNDPAAAFLRPQEESRGVTGQPTYKGAAAPNRYGIRPGHRWDGVDRGNGWESERFKAGNRRTRNQALDFAWQMDE